MHWGTELSSMRLKCLGLYPFLTRVRHLQVITKNQAGTKLSWNQALCFCDELDARLAKVPNAYVEKELQS